MLSLNNHLQGGAGTTLSHILDLPGSQLFRKLFRLWDNFLSFLELEWRRKNKEGAKSKMIMRVRKERYK